MRIKFVFIHNFNITVYEQIVSEQFNTLGY